MTLVTSVPPPGALMPVLRFAAANARGILSMTDSLTLGRELPVTMGGYPVRVVLLPPSIYSKNEEGGKLF